MDYTVPPNMRSRSDWKNLTPAEMDILVEGYRDLGFFCKEWFPNRFRRPYTRLHRQTIAAINAIKDEQRKRATAGKPANLKLCLIGTRGTAKTSFLFGLSARDILYGESPFVVPIGKSEGWMALHTENLRRGLVSSPHIKYYFGSMKEVRVTAEFKETYGKLAWVVATKGAYPKSLVMPRGLGQPIRGLQFDDYRPQGIYLDDVDDIKHLKNEELRNYTYKEWFRGDVCYAVSTFEDDALPSLIIVGDSCKHANSLAERCSRDDDFEVVRISVCTPDYKTIDPRFISQESLDKQIDSARKSGTLDTLARELMSIPVASENCPFKSEVFQYYVENQDDFNSMLGLGHRVKLVDFNNRGMESFLLVDPARTLSTTAAFSSIVGVTIDFDNPAIYIREIFNERCHPHEMVKAMLDMARRLRAYVIGVEFIGLHLHLHDLIRTMMAKRGMFNYQVVDLKPTSGKGEHSGYSNSKEARIIWGLSGLYKNHIIWHHPRNCGVLESQLLGMPGGSDYVDVADATSYIPQILETLGLEFAGFNPLGYDDPEGLDVFTKPIEVAARIINREYEPLYFDAPYQPIEQTERFAGAW